MSTEPPPPPNVSADGNFYWDGTRWVSMQGEVPRVERPAQVNTTSWESIAALIGVTTVLLPVEGVLIRWMSFYQAESDAGFQAPSATVAVNASVPELAATALAGIYLPASAFILGALLIGFVDQRWSLDSADKRVRSLVLGVLIVATPCALSFIYPYWLAPAVGFEGGFIGYLWLAKANLNRVDALFVAALLAAFFAGAAGLSGNPSSVDPLLYRFQAQAVTHLPDGRYVALGRADGVSYLQSCADRSFHVVPDAQIVDARYVEHATSLSQPSVLEMLLRWKGPVLGYRPDC